MVLSVILPAEKMASSHNQPYKSLYNHQFLFLFHEGARAKTDSDYGIALTGVAGPDSLEGHPAGTVFIGIADRNQVRSIKVVIGGRSRSDVRYISTLYAFNLVRQALLQEDII